MKARLKEPEPLEISAKGQVAVAESANFHLEQCFLQARTRRYETTLHEGFGDHQESPGEIVQPEVSGD